MKVKLVLFPPMGNSQEFFVEQFPAVIGRSPSADISIVDRWASRFHCELHWNDGQLVVRDLDSTYGTLVNGRHIHECELSSGDKLHVGLSTLTAVFEMESSSAVVSCSAAEARLP